MIEIDGKQYLTVKEFSELAGISKQAVYGQVSTRLEQFTIQVENRKMIEKSALDLFYSSQVDSTNSSADLKKSQPKSEEFSFDISKELFKALQDELKKKDQQIERLQADNKDLQENLKNAYTQIAEMAQKAQYITAADKTERIMQQQSKEDIVDTAAAAAENQNTEEKPKKKWYQFWK